MQKKMYTLLACLVCLSTLFAASLAFAAQDDEKQAAALGPYRRV
jgi:hypothetical protein